MSQRAALLIGKLSHAQKEWQQCSQVASKLHEYPDGNREDFISKCKSGEFDGVHALYRSNDSNPLTGDFNAELLDVLPKSLKYVCHNGAAILSRPHRRDGGAGDFRTDLSLTQPLHR